MRRTGFVDLIAPFLVIGITAYVLLRFSYGSIPPFGYPVPVPITALALVEIVVGRRVRAAVRHEPNARPITAIAVARCVALGKASAIVGAAVCGAALALLIRVAPDAGSVSAASHDIRVAALTVGAAALLTGAGLILERSGIDPNRDRENRSGAGG